MIPPLSISPTWVVHLLQLMSLYWHIIVHQRPQTILRFTLGAVYFIGLDKCIMTCIYHCRFIQNSLIAFKGFFSSCVSLLQDRAFQKLREKTPPWQALNSNFNCSSLIRLLCCFLASRLALYDELLSHSETPLNHQIPLGVSSTKC